MRRNPTPSHSVGLDGAPLENGVDAAAMLAHARRGGRAPVVTVLRARAPSAQFWIRAKCAQERSKARSAVRRAALAAEARRTALVPGPCGLPPPPPPCAPPSCWGGT